MQVSTNLLGELVQELQRGGRAGNFPNGLWQKIYARGWAYHSDVEDLLQALDRRLNQFNVEALAALAGVPWRAVRDRPRYITADWGASFALDAADLVGLCIFLEQCGFLTDASSMVSTLYDRVAARRTMSLSEAEIYSFGKLRHRGMKLLRADEDLVGETGELTWRGANGYRFRCLTRDGQIASLRVIASMWRASRRVELTCPTCGMTYTQGDPESAQSHRAEHHRLMRLLTPRSNRAMRIRMGQVGAGEMVDAAAPIWMHREIHERAIRFKRDFGYDSIPWPFVAKRSQMLASWVGYVFAASDGAIDGACGFQQANDEWTLGWVWIRPERRRSGLLAARWPTFLSQFGDFWIEHPLSKAMQAFVVRYASAGQRAKIADRITAPPVDRTSLP